MAWSARDRGVPPPPRGRWYASEYDPVKMGSIDGTDVVAHDKALLRAQRARYKPPKVEDGATDPERSIFVFRLSPRTEEDSLRQFFARFGRIAKIRLVRDKVTGESRRYAFIEYARERDAELAFHRGHEATIDDARIAVDYQRAGLMPGWVPRRLGGGLGGRKESGQMRFGGRTTPFRDPIPPTSRRSAGERDREPRGRDGPPKRERSPRGARPRRR